ncbi:MAG: GNAT family N-acetyltransferase [Lachnospiraceae bacterium]|nr:GNAT family N-acetyltransferase [Lachnospiraceae bacterium]
MNVELIKADLTDSIKILEMQKICFAPHLERYHDYDTSPANSCLERIRWQVENENFFKIYSDDIWVGSINIKKQDMETYKLYIINILPEYQGKKIGQTAIKLAEAIFTDAKKWMVETIEDMYRERRLYEKLGYKFTGKREKINDKLTVVFYEKEVNISDKWKYYYANNEDEKNIIDEIVSEYPLKLNPYLISLLGNSEKIRRQFLPSPAEADKSGTKTPFEKGKDAFKIYGLEQVYRDRVLLSLNFECPAYCRFCYKKNRVMRQRPEMSYEQIDKAISQIEQLVNVRGVLITGGEPFLSVDKLFYALEGLARLKNIHEIRIGTRALLTMPFIFTDEICDKIKKYIFVCPNNPKLSKSVAFNVHFNHIDELTAESISAISNLVSRGILLRNQTVLLKGINNDIETIKELFTVLLRNRVIPYYFNHCMPVEGGAHFRCTVECGKRIYNHLCTESSTTIPHYVYAPAIGKVHIGPDTKIIPDECNMIKTKTLYRADEFLAITKNKTLPLNHNIDEEGFVIAQYIDGYD